MKTKLMALFAMLLLIVPGFAQVSADTQASVGVNTDVASVDADVSAQAGITPDNPFWGLEVALDKLSLALTLSAKVKAEKGLNIAAERVAEAQVMLEQRKTAAANAAVKAHAEVVDVTSEAVASLDGSDAKVSVEETIRIKNRVEAQQELEATLPETIKLRLRAQGASAEVQEDAEITLKALSSNTNRIRVKVEAKENEIRVDAKARGVDLNKTLADVEAQIKTELKARADARVKEAVSAMANVNLQANASGSTAVLIANAETKLKIAQDAYASGDYGMAYGQATAALSLIRAAVSAEVRNEVSTPENQAKIRADFEVSAITAKEIVKGKYLVTIDSTCKQEPGKVCAAVVMSSQIVVHASNEAELIAGISAKTGLTHEQIQAKIKIGPVTLDQTTRAKIGGNQIEVGVSAGTSQIQTDVSTEILGKRENAGNIGKADFETNLNTGVAKAKVGLRALVL